MKNLIPDLTDRETLVTLLLAADILAKRGEPGPLSRVFACRKKEVAKFDTASEMPTPVDPEEER